MTELVFAAVCGVLALVCLTISVMQFREKGYLFNNAYIWATKEEREHLNKKPHYRQSAIAFAIATALFLIMAIECILLTGWLWLLVMILAGILLVYAIVSSSKEAN